MARMWSAGDPRAGVSCSWRVWPCARPCALSEPRRQRFHGECVGRPAARSSGLGGPPPHSPRVAGGPGGVPPPGPCAFVPGARGLLAPAHAVSRHYARMRAVTPLWPDDAAGSGFSGLPRCAEPRPGFSPGCRNAAFPGIFGTGLPFAHALPAPVPRAPTVAAWSAAGLLWPATVRWQPGQRPLANGGLHTGSARVCA